MPEWKDTDLLTAADVAKLLGVTSEATVERMVEDRTCPKPTLFGKQKRWRWGVIRQWMDAVEFIQLHGLQIPTNFDKTAQNGTNGNSEENEDCDRPKKR